MAGSTEQVTLTIDDIKALERLAVAEAQLNILVGDFQSNRKLTQENFKEIKETIAQILDLTRSVPHQITDCRRELERDFEGKYMTTTDGVILERHISDKVKSVKLWIVSSVGGFTSCGLVVMWALNFFKIPVVT